MNLAQTINLFGTGTSEGAKKAWETMRRGEPNLKKAPAEKIGRTTLAYSLPSAVETITSQIKAHSPSLNDPKDAAYHERWLEDARKNWTRGMRGAFEGKVTKDDLDNIRAGIKYNENNQIYQKVVDRFGPDAVIVRGVSPYHAKHFGDSDDKSPQAERVGYTTHVYPHGSLSDVKHVEYDPSKPVDKIIGSSQNFGGIAAVLRHEYGHHVYDKLNETGNEAGQDLIRRWNMAYAETGSDRVRDHVTFYAGEKPTEAFSEVFALRTDPNFHREKWTGADKLWNVMDEVVNPRKEKMESAAHFLLRSKSRI